MREYDMYEWLHVYGQYTYHAPVTVRGSREGLLALRSAIDAALETGRGESSAMASDGEGYRIDVSRVSTHANLGSPEYIYEAHGSLMAAEANRAREYGLRNPYGKYRRVDEIADCHPTPAV